MKLEFDTNPQDFLKSSAPQLERELSTHSLILSLVARYRDSGKSITTLTRGTDQNGNLLIAGVQTDPDRALIISKASDEEARLFAQSLAERLKALPGVNGPSPAVDKFADAWTSIKRCQLKLGINLRLFELKEVIRPLISSGFARLAQSKDREIIFQWIRAFQAEAVPNDPKQSDEEVYKDIEDALGKDHYFVWEDGGKVVCLLGSRRETLTERWIAPVYTPKDMRGRGYASALVADVSQRIVNSGKNAMLFTDLANPTSNSIYQKVGYRPVADFKHYFFT